MKKRVFLKNFLPLIIAFVAAFVFFASYNRYLLDSSLVNLKISLRELEKTDNPAEVRKLKEILDNAFILEITKEEFDLAAALKMEMASELIEEISPEKQEKNKEYVKSMSSASVIETIGDIVSSASENRQVEDAKYFVKEIISDKEKGKTFLVSQLENFIISLTPSKPREELRDIRKVIEKRKKKLAAYTGEKLQTEYLKIVRLYLRIKDYGKALLYVNRTIKVDPENSLALTAKFYSGILYKVRKDFKKAQRIFNEIKDYLPDQWQSFSTHQEANSLYALGETEQAIALFEENFSRDPSQDIRQISQFRAGYIYLYDLENPAVAEAAFKKLTQKAKNSHYTKYYAKKLKKDVAVQYIYQGFELLKQGYRTFNSEKYHAAMEKFDSALEVSYDADLAYSGKSLAYNLLGNSSEALKAADKTRLLASRSAEAAAVLGFIYYSLGMVDKAIEEYKIASDSSSGMEISHYNLGTIYLQKKDYTKAKKYFNRAIKANSNFAYVHNNLGYIYWVEGNYRKAEKFFSKAISLDQDYIEPKYNLGVVLFTLGRYETARKSFDTVSKLQPGFRKTQRYLAMIKEKLGY